VSEADRRDTQVKLLAWDLDNTLWDGILMEGDSVRPRQDAVSAIKTLDGRGILHSIASRNDPVLAMQKLVEFGLANYFLYPQIGWGSKSDSLAHAATLLGIDLNAVAFIDDDPFERAEVQASHPQVLCIDADAIKALNERPEFVPRFVTDESRIRRELYRTDIKRKADEERAAGQKEDFLAGLEMRMSIFSAGEEDLKRAEELTVRTSQLNATGYTYSYDELEMFRVSARHRLLMARLEDRFGSYGTIGLALLECDKVAWTIKLLLISCRVMSRGAGAVLLGHILRSAKANDVVLRAEFLPTDRNRMMNVTYRLSGFTDAGASGRVQILQHDLAEVPALPSYVKLLVDDEC
jgi:FkbH-like protein